MDDLDHGAGRNRREVSAAVVIGRAARELVAPVQEKLGDWQAEAVKLEVMVQRMRATGRRDPGLAESVRTLLDVVEMQAETLTAEAANAPPAVREHSRVADTLKVLRLLAGRLRELLDEDGGPGGRPR